MNRWLALTMLLVLSLAGCTGKDDGDADPTPTPATSTPSPTPTRATPTPTATPPTATPSATPTATPSATPPTPTPPAPSTKVVDFTFAFTAGAGADAPVPGLPVGEAGANCGGFAPAVVLGGNATATYEGTGLPVGGGEIELVVLGPDGAVLARAAGASPITLNIPAAAQGANGIKLVVQYVEEPATAETTDVSVTGSLLIPADASSPAQDAPTTCERVE